MRVFSVLALGLLLYAQSCSAGESRKVIVDDDGTVVGKVNVAGVEELMVGLLTRR